MLFVTLKHENLDQQIFLASFGFYLELSFLHLLFHVLIKVNYDLL